MIATQETDMRLVMTIAMAVGLAGALAAQVDESSGSRTVLGGPTSEDLAAGAIAIQAGDYDGGIELTLSGLENRALSTRDRAAGLSNLCAAYAVKELPSTAVRYCTESLAIDDTNWRAYSNRSYAYWMMGRYSEAQTDLDAAAALNDNARQIAQIRGMINEMRLRPNIVMEDLQ